GLALLIPDIQTTEAIYLSSGAVVIGMIGVGCVLAAQIVSSAKQTGVVAYQRTLPVKRYEIIFADLIIWGLASVPGIVMAWIAACWRFHLNLTINPLSIIVVGLVQVTMILIGFSIAYWLPTNMVSVATQVIMIGGLLFLPITYICFISTESFILSYRVLFIVSSTKS
ncbi:ABC transporter permease, partial [Pediococcus acidilactici]|nr:ABC transporter permease [Pediococcus acidilactici]